MRGVKLPLCVISPTRMTIRSPLLAEKVQESESPTGEMVPLCVHPLVSAPWASTVLEQSVTKESRAAKYVRILIRLSKLICPPLEPSIHDVNAHSEQTVPGMTSPMGTE